MADTTLSKLSLEYVAVPITHFTANGVAANPTSDSVYLAFKLRGARPAAGDWIAAAWETDAGPPVQYLAKVLVGPGGAVQLSPGTYTVWAKVTDNPEVPILSGGTLIIE
jgi:hypothetical protein